MEDLNTSGHVSNVAFLAVFDEARTQFLGGKMRSSPHRGIFDDGVFDKAHYVLGQHIVEYHRELFYSVDPLRVRTWISHIGTTSFVLNAEILEPGIDEPACALETAAIFLTRGDDRPWPMDDATRELLRAYAGPRVPLRPRVRGA